MNPNTKLLLKAFRKESLSRPPFWFMRQAGRYLPEYRKIREQTKDFLDMCYTPAKAAEVTLQPLRRFGMDAAIIFSDILVIPHALGVEVRFEEKKGPVLDPIKADDALGAYELNMETLEPVYEALRQTKAALPEETALIGFAGSPWTLACYMVQGKSDKDFQQVRAMALKNRVFFKHLIDLLTQSVIRHTQEQIRSGAEVIQLFDSWAGVLSEQEFHEWVIEPTRTIVASLKKNFPQVPVIGFPRQAGTKYLDYALGTKVDMVSIDSSVSLEWARRELLAVCGVQGNLDPLLLAQDKDSMLHQAQRIISMLSNASFSNNPFIFNLGHGILPHTPVEHVQSLCDLIKLTDMKSVSKIASERP
jgi:uroporphyrinogen decarboxylase